MKKVHKKSEHEEVESDVEAPVSEEKVQDANPEKDKVAQLTETLVYFRDNVVHGNADHVKRINSVLEA